VPTARSGAIELPGEVHIYEENDYLYFLTTKDGRSDRWYTQGFRAEWTHSSLEPNQRFLFYPAVSWCALLCGSGYENGFTNTGWSLGQSIYTPRDISIATPQTDDRPWAAHLYASRIMKQTYMAFGDDAERQDGLEFSLGVVGPWALGEEVQNTYHRIAGFKLAEGWDNQLGNELAFLFRYDVTFRFPACASTFDVLPMVRGYLGNVMTAVETGMTIRLGRNLRGFGNGTIGPSVTAPAATPAGGAPIQTRWKCPIREPAGFLDSFALFGRANVRAVAHNIFLDGNTFRDGPNIEKNSAFYEFAWGVDAMLTRRLGISWQFVHRGPEFSIPAGVDKVQQYGAIQLYWVNVP
jgi:lipid A 3-O-deacylase